MTTRTFAVTALLVLAGSLAACGDDDSATGPASPSGPEQGSAVADSDSATADGASSDWYTEVAETELPSTGAATLTIGGETIELDGRCSFAVDNVSFDGVPDQSADAFKFTFQGSGPRGDGQNVAVLAFRLVNPDHIAPDPYETDRVQINVDGSDEPVASFASVRRAQPGGAVTGDGDDLPFVRIRSDGSAMTVTGVAGPMSGDDASIAGPFQIAAHCG